MGTAIIRVENKDVEILNFDMDFTEEPLKVLTVTDHFMKTAYKHGGEGEVANMIYDKIEQLAKEVLNEGYLLTGWTKQPIIGQLGTTIKIYGKKR